MPLCKVSAYAVRDGKLFATFHRAFAYRSGWGWAARTARRIVVSWRTVNIDGANLLFLGAVAGHEALDHALLVALDIIRDITHIRDISQRKHKLVHLTA
jgi:hypothetical protein